MRHLNGLGPQFYFSTNIIIRAIWFEMEFSHHFKRNDGNWLFHMGLHNTLSIPFLEFPLDNVYFIPTTFNSIKEHSLVQSRKIFMPSVSCVCPYHSEGLVIWLKSQNNIIGQVIWSLAVLISSYTMDCSSKVCPP